MVTVITEIVETPAEIRTETIETDRETRISKVNAAIAVIGATTTGATMEKRVDAIEHRGLKRRTT